MQTGTYSSEDRERYVTEVHKRGERTEFERDRARILHSSAWRRLGAKTQVLGPTADDFSRTRLTHSLEVAQVGRELGKMLGCDPDVVDAACLAHDLGHPPFGHSGERILNNLAKDIGGFEGNAQTLRLVAALEPKVVAPDGSWAGLNLTRATLDAIAKYPWSRGEGPKGWDSPKFGVYEEDQELFRWVRAPQRDNPGKRCIEAQVMDLSDDIAYSVHDVEDAVALGSTKLGNLDQDATLTAVIQATKDWYRSSFALATHPKTPAEDGFTVDDLAAAYRRLREMPFWLTEEVGDYASQAALKNLSSQLIGRFVLATQEATRQAAQAGYAQAPLTRYTADLVIPAETRAEILLLKGIAVYYVMAPRETTFDHLSQQQILADLVWALRERQEQGQTVLEEPYLTLWKKAGDHPRGRQAGRLRAVIDQVASLTDLSAMKWHARLLGMISRPV